MSSAPSIDETWRGEAVNEAPAAGTGGRTWSTPPPMWLGALDGAALILAFAIFHDVFIVDIWWNIGPMLVSGALCGFVVVWSYRRAVRNHSTRGWFLYVGLYAAEMMALGVISISTLRPRMTIAEAMLMDDAMAELTPPTLPLMIGVIAVGTILCWHSYGRRRTALVPILVTQVLVVFLLGHQLAFLGLVEPSSASIAFFGEFAVIAVGIVATFALAMMWSTILLERLRGEQRISKEVLGGGVDSAG